MPIAQHPLPSQVRYFNEFLRDNAPRVAMEIVSVYVKTMSRIVLSVFKQYYVELSALQLEIPRGTIFGNSGGAEEGLSTQLGRAAAAAASVSSRAALSMSNRFSVSPPVHCQRGAMFRSFLFSASTFPLF